MIDRKTPWVVVAVVAAASLVACTPPAPFGPSGPNGPDSPNGPHTSQGWPAPSATRPVVDLEFRVADDLRSVSGTERVVFTPDLEVCELVFRAWPNKPATADWDNSLVVVSATVDGAAAEPEVSAGGAPRWAPGTLVEIPLPACVQPGTEVTAELGFQLELGPGTDERVGMAEDGTMAWFGTAYPLLAWENGRGWARDEAVRVAGETVTSETFNLESLRVVAPSRYAVTGAGEPVRTDTDKATGVTTHEFRAPAIRDLSVTVGEIETVERRVGGSVIHVAGPTTGLDRPLDHWADAVSESVQSVSEYLGAVPYDHIWVSVIPDQTEGIEFPGAMQLGNLDLDRERWLITHEVAHLWVYGLVGNNQARDPWLDESFAAFVQQVADSPARNPEPTNDSSRRSSTEVGWSMEEWDGIRRASDRYVSAVYGAGADMLIQARRDVGPAAFDQALRAYLHANAHQIATPEDVERSFAQLPQVIERLRSAGAL